TPVPTEAFESIKNIHKVIQSYYDTFSQSDRIYYERRTREYNKNNWENGIRSNQIFTIPMQLMCHVAMFLDSPHLSEHEYYGKLLKSYANVVFQDTDIPIVYYTSARTLFKVEKWIHSLEKPFKQDVKPYRFFFLMIIRQLYTNGTEKLRMNSHAIENLCQRIINEIEDEERFEKLISEAKEILLTCISKATEKKGRVNHKKLTYEIIQHFNIIPSK
ncbi:MAG: hypothetical protein K2H85_00850, partial [Allobaculum sp.]|nr:hypothetical protein [Allobaculum sp.]